MTSRARLPVALALALALAGAPVALADVDPSMCLAPDGTPTSCPAGTAPDPFSGTDPGLFSTVPKVFIAIFVVVALLGVATTVWRVSLARRMATGAGLDPGQATAVALLSENGVDAAYLAASLRPAAPAGPSVEDRLRELQRLRDQGLVTADEFETRRTAILDSL